MTSPQRPQLQSPHQLAPLNTRSFWTFRGIHHSIPAKFFVFHTSEARAPRSPRASPLESALAEVLILNNFKLFRMNTCEKPGGRGVSARRSALPARLLHPHPRRPTSGSAPAIPPLAARSSSVSGFLPAPRKARP